MRKDGRQQVCIVGLQEFEVFDVQIVKDFIEKGNASRSTGSTGANEESSRSHAILQLVVKKHNKVKARKVIPKNQRKIHKELTRKLFNLHPSSSLHLQSVISILCSNLHLCNQCITKFSHLKSCYRSSHCHR
ncbi:hypothetical protein RYX36_030247 [Vicia faba]